MDREERYEFIAKNRWLAYAFVERTHYCRHGVSNEDVLSAAFEGLCEAARTFDPAKGKFSTCAWFWMHNTVRLECNFGRVPFRVPRRAQHRIRQIVRLDLSDVGVTPGANLEDEDERARIVADLDAAINRLPARWALIIRQRSGGMTLKQIGDGLGLSKERVRQIEAKAKVTLRTLLAPRYGRETCFSSTSCG